MKNVDDVTSPFEGTWRKPIVMRCSEASTHNVNVHYYSHWIVLSTAKFLEHSNNQQTLIFLPQKWVHTYT